MKFKSISLALASAFSLSAGVALADDAFQGSWYLMPTIGVMHPDSSGSGNLEAKNTAPAYGIKLGKQLSEHWDVQIGGSYAKADADYSDSYGKATGNYKQVLFGVDALYMFSRDKFRPFVLAGLGYAHNDVNYKYLGVDVGNGKSSWMGEVGLGAQYFFSDRVGLQADLRETWSRASANARYNGSTVYSGGNQTVANPYFNVGLIINFPPPPKPAPVAVAVVAPEPAKPSLPEVAPYDEEVYEFTVEETIVDEGPAKPTVKVTLSAEVLFGFDKDTLRDEGKALLDKEVAEKMKAHPEAELVLIAGYTDRIGDDKYNLKLSERRANAVKKYLISQGVEESRLHTVGKGKADPVVDCKGVRGKKLIDCLQPNRRVVVEVERQRAVEEVTVEQVETQGVVVEEQKQ